MMMILMNIIGGHVTHENKRDFLVYSINSQEFMAEDGGFGYQ